MDANTGIRVAEHANVLATWLGVRDTSRLDRAALAREAHVGDGVADVFVLFGGGILGAVEVLANAMRAGVARTYGIVGGRGRATFGLERALHACEAVGEPSMPDVRTASEAEMLAFVLRARHGLMPDFLETQSTNCGNNIGFLLDLLDDEPTPPRSIILCQDAAMQRRMDATWRRQVIDRPRYANTQVLNWALHHAELAWENGALVYRNAPEGMWDIDFYLDLLLGDVARLTDDEHGYGPRGTDYVVHVDVPASVRRSWQELRMLLGAEAHVR